MIKYAKVINEETGLCEVGTGTNSSFYQSIGMTQLDVQQSDIDNNWYLAKKCPMKSDEEKAKEERERIALLNMTGADVERAIYKVKGIDFDDILAMVKDNPTIEEKALKIEFKANNFFRGNPYIEQVGSLLGFTSEMLDKFFDTKDYRYLTTCKLTINATPTEATVTGDGNYPYGTLVDYKVELEGYKPYIDSIELLKDTELNIELEKIEEVVDENTTDTTQSDIQDELDTTTSKSDETGTDNV